MDAGEEPSLPEDKPESFATVREQARVAWLYFQGGLTQREIAVELGMTRLRVNKIIGQVRDDGSVKIDVNLPLIDCIEIEQQLKQAFGLADAIVVPAVSDITEQQRTIGEAGGLMINGLIEGRNLGIGIGWGYTLNFAARRLTARPTRDSWVVSLTGGFTRGSGSNTFEIATAVARALDVECHYLTAPIYCSSMESRETLLHNEEIADVLARTEIAEVALVSCGDLSARSPIVSLRIVKDHYDDLVRLGAVGEVLGCFLGEDGQPVRHFLNDSIMAMSLEALRLKPVSALVSGGVHKASIIHAILRGRYINRLVTDERVARILLERAT